MPQVIPFIADLIIDAGFTSDGVAAFAAASTIANAIVDIAVVAAVSIGLAEIEKALAPKQTVVPNNTLVKNSIVNRQLAYGRCAVGGAIVYIGENGSNNEYLNLVFAMTDHEIDGVEQLVFDNWILNFDNTGMNGGGVCTGEIDVRTGVQSTRFANLVFCNFHLGVAGDTADASLMSNSNGEWTSDCTLSGCSYVYLRITWNQNVFSAGIPNIYCVVRGKKVLDPRTAIWPTGSVTSGSNSVTVTSATGLAVGQAFRGPGIPPLTTITAISGTTLTISANANATWSNQLYIAGSPFWSENSALCYFDYHMDQTYGFRSQPGEWDQGYLTTAANTCDVRVPLANDNFPLIAVGQWIYGPGLPTGTKVAALGSYTVTMSNAATASFECRFVIANVMFLAQTTAGSTTMTIF